MIKTFSLGLDLLKVWFNVSLELSNCRKLLFSFCKTRSIERQARPIETRICRILFQPKLYLNVLGFK